MSKPPAKRAAKRKAEDAIASAMDASNAARNAPNALLASLDLSSSISSRNIADALLTLLPEGATKQHSSAKKLAKAFPLVIAELDNRSNILARKSESEGQSAQIAFRFQLTEGVGKQGERDPEPEQFTTIQFPEETFVGILKFLNGRELVSTVSLVCKSWLATSRIPSLWTKLDDTCGLTNKSRKLNMTAFLKLLARPQFAFLKRIMMPHHSLQLSKTSISKMAKLLPHLETFEMGSTWSTGPKLKGISKMAKLLPHLETFEMGSTWSTGPKLKDEHIVAIAENFTKLNAIINIEMWHISNTGITNMAQAMGGKLLDLRINGSIYYLADSALSAIASSCPNLKSFQYKLSWGYSAAKDYLSGGGIVNLCARCRRLEILGSIARKS